MQLYSDKEKLKKDIYWLSNECSFHLFADSKPSKYAFADFVNSYLKETTLENSAILNALTTLFTMHSIAKSKWLGNILEEDLPCIAVVPNHGIYIVLEKTATDEWKCESRDGISYLKDFKEGSIFYRLRKRRKEKGGATAYDMFKLVALREKKHIFHAALATVSINILALGTSLFTMQVYDRVIPTHGISTLIALMVGVFIAIILEMIIKISRSVILDEAAVSMDRSYSHNIFDRFLKIRLDSLPNSIGTLSGQLQGYATVRAFISTAAMFFIIDFPFVFFFLAVIVMIGGFSMGLIPLIFLLISISVAFFFKKRIEILTEQSVAASNKKLGLLVESVENAETIKASGASHSVRGKWNALTEYAIDDDIAIRHATELSTYIAALLQQFSYVILIGWGAYLASTTGELTTGGLIAVSILSSRVLSPLAALPNIFVQLGRAKISIKDLNNIFSLPQDNEGVQKPLSPEVLEPRYTCKNLQFSYSEGKNILNIPSLNINSGERVAVLGVIGSGKSTLLKVLAGLYAPQRGSVLLGGIDIQHISRDKLSQTIGYLPQSTKLFSGTLRENLTLGLIGIDDAQILGAAQKTGLINFINALPKGLDTFIPEGGNTLSGGQKQLIAITRLVISNPAIWLLDEPTANMDDFTEKNIINVLNSQIAADKTLILVTHKPALLALVNRIIVLTSNGIAMDGPKNAVLEKLANNQKVKPQVPKPTQTKGQK